MKAFINQLIRDQKKLYTDNYHQAVRDYNEEVSTVKGYNGRQLLELLQNCDDEGSKEVLIELDADLKTISVSNNGAPFSEKGYRSLFIANLSPKSATRKYIGNKGLGFRSIINWSDAIEIHSNKVSLLYSEKNRVNSFKSLFKENNIEHIRSEYGFAETIFPMPFLSTPEIKEIGEGDFVTTIIIHYKENFFEDIIEQVKSITAETLLFLRNIQEVNFRGFENRDGIVCLKETINAEAPEFLPRQQVVYEGSSWEIFETDHALPEEFSDSDKKEKEHYQIKIAVEENLRQNTPFLYSFFPTNIRLSQPYILHATFDLDPTRNQIVNTAKNRFILAEVVHFTVKVAKYFAARKVSYRPLQILRHNHFADSLISLGYYKLIQDEIASELIFPCIDNTYKRLKDVIFIDNEFAKMLIDFNAIKILDCHLIPIIDEEVERAVPIAEIDRSISVFDNPLEIINEIACLPLTIHQRARFIKKTVMECAFLKSTFPNQLNILINNKGEIIKGSEYIYTPITQNEELETPSFTNIQFLDKDLFDELIIQLEYNSRENTVKSRYLYEQLNGFCNIHSYEPATLSQKIISETNNRINEFPENSIRDIQEMNRCLFSNFPKLDREARKSLIRIAAPTITLNGLVVQAEDVVFSVHYSIGIKNEKIFEGVYTDKNYIASPKHLGLIDFENIQEVEEYLLWLGVNRFAKYRRYTTKTQLIDYRDYLIKIKNVRAYTAYELTYTEIDNFEGIINRMSLNQLITWIYFDYNLKKQLSNINNTDMFKHHYYSWSQPILDKPSYLKYQLIIKCRKSFSGFLIDERFPWVNNITIDYRAEIFEKNEVSKTSINEILMLLGAKDDFNLLSIDKVADIINRLPERYPDGKRSQAFYKRALTHYKINKQELRTAVKLFADDGSGLGVFDQGEIYFSDKIKLPNQLKKEFPVFNFPLRSGGAEAIKFFKINDLRDVKIEIKSFVKLNELTIDFDNYFERLKPLILTQRMYVVEDQILQKEQASICNKIEIVLCSEIYYQASGKDYEVADYEFLPVSGYTYYLKVNSYDTTIKLRRNSFFIESFADIISVSFDISGEKNEFKYLLRNDYEDALLSTKIDFGEDTIQEAGSLLGLSDHKQAFWSAVFTAKGIPFEDHLDDKALELLLKEQLGIGYKVNSIEYENINHPQELSKIRELFTSINLSLKDFATFYQYKISMEAVHYKRLQNYILSKKRLIKSSVWHYIKDGSIEEKSGFLDLINKFENYDEFVKQESLNSQFDFSLDLDNLIKKYILARYGSLRLVNNQDPDEFRATNLELFTKEDQYKIQQSERLKSLLFFSDAISTIKSEINTGSNDDDEIKEESEKNNIKENIEIVSSDVLIPKAQSSNGKVTKGVFSPKEINSRKLKDKGHTSEKIVFDYLSGISEEVYWAALDNEGLHYDIRYLNEKNEMKYIEVKSFDHEYFHLSKEEFDFGNNHQADYEIWLVRSQHQIIPIKDFFTNQKYEKVANEYLIHLNFLDN